MRIDLLASFLFPLIFNSKDPILILTLCFFAKILDSFITGQLFW